MRHGAALTGAALAAGAFALIAGPGSAATVEIPSLAGTGCCSISDGSNLEFDPAGDPAAVKEVVNGEFERAADSLGPQAIAIKESGRVGDDIPDGVSLVAA